MKKGDKVRFNGKYGLEKYYPENVFTVASEPWTVGDFQLVKLEGYGGGFRTDGLEVVEDA